MSRRQRARKLQSAGSNEETWRPAVSPNRIVTVVSQLSSRLLSWLLLPALGCVTDALQMSVTDLGGEP